jgi:hypothetical protein
MECAAASPFSHFAESPTGHLDMWLLLLRYSMGWSVFFYAVVCAVAILQRAGIAMKNSSKAHENSVFVLAQGIGCTAKSLIVSTMGIYVLCDHWDEPPQSHFGGSNQAFMAGLIFGSFEVMDLCTCFLHNMLSAIKCIHHVLHVGFGLIIFYNCGPHFLVAVLTAQDLSSVPLCMYLLLRHRHPNHPFIVALYAVFTVTFVAVRIVLGTWGTYYYLTLYHGHLVEVEERLFQAWQAHLLAAALVAASMLQFAFFSQVVSNGLRMLRPEVPQKKAE